LPDQLLQQAELQMRWQKRHHPHLASIPFDDASAILRLLVESVAVHISGGGETEITRTWENRAAAEASLKTLSHMRVQGREATYRTTQVLRPMGKAPDFFQVVAGSIPAGLTNEINVLVIKRRIP
jgi:hypothetical protein